MKKLIELEDLIFYENKFYTISGSNNSGKTTLIRTLKRNANLKRSVETVIPFEIIMNKTNLFEELKYQNIDIKLIDYLLKGLKFKSISKLDISNLTKKNIILAQIVLALAHNPKVLLLDSISNYLSDKELESLYKFLRDYKDKYNLTLISTTIHLEEALLSDYLYILNEGKILLEGDPLEVLQNDNILNRIGLNIPFMVDLSVKLRDYELITEVELNKDRMVDILWK